VRWLTFLKEVDQSMWRELSKDMPELKKAMTALEFLSQSREARLISEMREKALMDERSALNRAKRIGREEERVEVAKNMLALGIDLPLILQATNLPEQELKKLQAEISTKNNK
jgi:predicted transposase/invertase (TIGR01784 family)